MIVLKDLSNLENRLSPNPRIRGTAYLGDYLYLLFFFGKTTGQGLPVLQVGLTFSDLLITHNTIITPIYRDTGPLGFEPITGMLLGRMS